jgi:hypothetical protein
MDNYSNKKDIEICVVKLHILSLTIITKTVYRSPSVNITYVLNNLKTDLNQVHNNTADIILRGDFNINYFINNRNKQAINFLFTSYSPCSTIDFPTRIHNILHTVIDNIFINKFKNESYSIYSLINGLSVHDAQGLSLSTVILPDIRNEFYSYRKISKHLLNEFQTGLNHEVWENVFSNNNDDRNTIFNNFLNTSSGYFMLVFLKKNLCRILNPG